MDSESLLPWPLLLSVDSQRKGGQVLVLSVTEASLALIIIVKLHILHENRHHLL